MALDNIDQGLIALLRNDARMPVAKLAAAAGISRATATARIDKLRREGVIAGFTVVLQSNVESSCVRAITMIEIDGKQEEAVTQRLMGMPVVRQLSTTNGRWDVVAEIEAPTYRPSMNCCAPSGRSTALPTPTPRSCSRCARRHDDGAVLRSSPKSGITAPAAR